MWLYATPHAPIDDITVVTDIDDGVGVVRYTVAVVEAQRA